LQKQMTRVGSNRLFNKESCLENVLNYNCEESTTQLRPFSLAAYKAWSAISTRLVVSEAS